MYFPLHVPSWALHVVQQFQACYVFLVQLTCSFPYMYSEFLEMYDFGVLSAHYINCVRAIWLVCVHHVFFPSTHVKVMCFFHPPRMLCAQSFVHNILCDQYLFLEHYIYLLKVNINKIFCAFFVQIFQQNNCFEAFLY